MAKQTNVYQATGTYGGLVHYRLKGVKEVVARSLASGMSKLVKEDAAFENTRRNASEFGASGKFSGSMYRSIAKKWRYILVPFAAGKLTKSIREILVQDATNPWGQRTLSVAGWQDSIRDRAGRFVKNPYAEDFSMGFAAGAATTGGPITINQNILATDSERLAALGVEGVLYEFYKQRNTRPVFNQSTGKYDDSENELVLMGSQDAEIGQVHTDDIVTTTTANGENDDTIESMLVVALPYKVVNNIKYTLQELCSATWLPITVSQQ